MTVAVPAVRQLLSGTPKAGTLEEIEHVVRYIDALSQDNFFFMTLVGLASTSLIELESTAIAAIRGKLQRSLVPGSAALEDTAASAKAAALSYAAEVHRLHREADNITARLDSDLASITAAIVTIADICEAIRAPNGYGWQTPPSPTMPEPRLSPGALSAVTETEEHDAAIRTLREAYRTQWLVTALAWQNDLEDVETSMRRWRQLIEERKNAEHRLAEALDDTPVGQLITLGAGIAGGRKRAIAVGLTGEFRGVPHLRREPEAQHPLLASLIGTTDGSALWDSPPDPGDVVAWWSTLTQAEQDELIHVVPAVVGNLPGLLPSVRDRANRVTVEFYRANPQLLTPEQLKLAAAVQRILDVEARQARPQPPILLLAFAVTEDVPKAAVGYGNLDAATHTSWQVPGMNSDAPHGLPTWDIAARNLSKAQTSMLLRTGQNVAGVIAWLGYDTPNLPPDLGVLGSVAAVAGAERLAAELNGMHAARAVSAAGPPFTSVIAHSYGTTVASIALTSLNHPVDAFIMLGSAGLDTSIVPSLDVLSVKEVSPGQKAIYTTTAESDRIAPTGAALAGRGLPAPNAKAVLGLQERVSVYGGAISFPSDGDALRGLKATDGHSVIGQGRKPGAAGTSASEGNGYLDLETQTLETSARISTQTVDRRTHASFATTEERRVIRIEDNYSGASTYMRVPADGDK